MLKQTTIDLLRGRKGYSLVIASRLHSFIVQSDLDLRGGVDYASKLPMSSEVIERMPNAMDCS